MTESLGDLLSQEEASRVCGYAPRGLKCHYGTLGVVKTTRGRYPGNTPMYRAPDIAQLAIANRMGLPIGTAVKLIGRMRLRDNGVVEVHPEAAPSSGLSTFVVEAATDLRYLTTGPGSCAHGHMYRLDEIVPAFAGSHADV